MLVVAVLVNMGMWLERFVIIVVSLSRDFLPSSWGMYYPTWVDLSMLACSFGLFLMLFLLFCRYLPMVAMAEVKPVLEAGRDTRARKESFAARKEIMCSIHPAVILSQRRISPELRSDPSLAQDDLDPGTAVPGEVPSDERPANNTVGFRAAARRGRRAGRVRRPGDASGRGRAGARRRFTRWDAHSPYAVHGIDRAMGIRPTRLPWVALAGGIAGGAGALLMQWWMNAVNYPIVISGKPLFSLPANIPITFELIVLLSRVRGLRRVLVFNLLPQFWHWVFAGGRSAGHHRRIFHLDRGDRSEVRPAPRRRSSSRRWGRRRSRSATIRRRGQRLPSALYWGLTVLVVLSLLPPLLIARYRAVPKSSAADSSHSGHGPAAQIPAQGGQPVVCRRPGDAATRAGHRRPGPAGGRRPFLSRPHRRPSGPRRSPCP